ncbi:hypothetical protein O3P69_004170 [Scylla paramamosain]|uniref:Uncharacterized protein n=1 Tax=Scylla paramamosain TaxID=85552 RepID=A0AAW0UHX9_SCYPA
MPLPCRSPRSTPRASTTVVPRSLQPLLQQARQTISDQQQAITTLQANMAALITRGNMAPAPRVPLLAAPEKCDLDMTPAAFRSWKRSMECWLLLYKWPRQEAVHHVRLLCGPPLQRALDARFTFDQWSALTQQEALDAIGNLVLRSSSPAVQWAEFFGVSQGQDECVSDYFVRGAQKVNDCAFECPQCSLNLSEYLLLKKLVVGIRDTGLKQQVYQACDSLGSVDALRAISCAYEAARQHTTGVGGWRESSRAAGTVRAEEDGDQTLDHHLWQDTALTYLLELWSSRRPHGTASANAVSGSVTTAGANVSRQPTIEVTVALGKGAKHRTAAVADTGAQVCVAGAALLSSLNIQPTQLQGRAGLRDVADLPLRCLGSCRCDIYLGGHASQQEVYFVPFARSLFLSLSVCKELGLVPAGFPHHSLPTVQAVEALNPTARTANPAPTNPASRSTNHDTCTSLNPHPTSATPRTQEAEADLVHLFGLLSSVAFEAEFPETHVQLGLKTGRELALKMGWELGLRTGRELGLKIGWELGLKTGRELALETG